MPAFDEIALRRAERGLITGGVGSGKSTLAEYLIDDFVTRYPTGRVLILDTKPRFRAEWELTGLKAARRYKNWDHGPVVPNSVVGDLMQRDAGLAAVWRSGHRVAILQTDFSREWPLMLRGASQFYQEARTSRPQLLYADEMMDFFGQNGQPIPGLGDDRDVILRTARAGRERGLGLLAGMQRPKGVPITVVQELSRLYLFRLDNEGDMERLWDLGIPTTVYPPEHNKAFVYWRRGHPGHRMLQLRLADG